MWLQNLESQIQSPQRHKVTKAHDDPNCPLRSGRFSGVSTSSPGVQTGESRGTNNSASIRANSRLTRPPSRLFAFVVKKVFSNHHRPPAINQGHRPSPTILKTLLSYLKESWRSWRLGGEQSAIRNPKSASQKPLAFPHPTKGILHTALALTLNEC